MLLYKTKTFSDRFLRFLCITIMKRRQKNPPVKLRLDIPVATSDDISSIDIGNKEPSERLDEKRDNIGTGLDEYQKESASSHHAPYNEPRGNDFNVNKNSTLQRESPVSTFQNDVYSNKESPTQISKPTKEFEDYFVISVLPKTYRNVYVSHVISPGEFYCQTEENSAKLQSLMKTIKDTYTEGNDLSLSEFVVNAPCCAMYEDGAWYRGKIKKVDSGSCDVFFVDYGNTDSVSKSKIKMLWNDLFRCPSQALRCKAFNVSPKGADWSDGEINAFIDMALNKSFMAQFVECDSSDVYSVNLISIGKLQDDIFIKDYAMCYGRLQDTNKTLVLNSHAASTNLSFRAIDVKVSSSMPVQVTFGLNPAEIFCQFKTYEQKFKKMMVDLQNYCNKVPEAESIIDRPHQGMICAAQFILDSAWYRAEIKKVETNKLVVFYVDYGNSKTVDRKKVRCIIQEYTTLPMQAVKCKIRGIKPPGKSWIVNNNLCKYFEGNTVCKFISKEDDYFVVDMTCNQKDVAQLLISDKLALSDAPTPNKVESLKRTVSPPKITETAPTEVSELPGKVVPARVDSFVSGKLISVTISFIENPSKFWCQLLDECDILTDLMADIKDKISEISPVNGMSLKVGSYCIAQYFEDEAWYRAVIKQINHSGESGTTYKVFFIDYGNSEDATESQIKVMPPEFMKHPPQCFECCLLNSPSKLIPEMISLFRDTVEEVKEITAKVEKVKFGICTVTLLFDKDDQTVNISELLFRVKEPNEEGGMTTDYSSWVKYGTSYREIPRFIKQPKCSGRTALCRNVLNDHLVCLPSFSNDNSFESSRQAPFEKYKYRCEDDRFELDVVIETNRSTIKILEDELRMMNRMSNVEKDVYKLDDTLGGSSSVLQHIAIKRLYGEKALDIIEGLKKIPFTAVPLILKRLKMKEHEWRESQKRHNKIWKKQTENLERMLSETSPVSGCYSGRFKNICYMCGASGHNREDCPEACRSGR